MLVAWIATSVLQLAQIFELMEEGFDVINDGGCVYRSAIKIRSIFDRKQSPIMGDFVFYIV